jgi:hypothetical protein
VRVCMDDEEKEERKDIYMIERGNEHNILTVRE